MNTTSIDHLGAAYPFRLPWLCYVGSHSRVGDSPKRIGLGEGVVDPIDAVLGVPQTDDAGAQTADRYEWQSAMAAADGLGMYMRYCNGSMGEIDKSQIKIVCEYHEDWIIHVGSFVELVSAKHRESATGPWSSISDLVENGGLGHLYTRWLMVGGQAKVRLVSNADTSQGEARKLIRCSELLSRISNEELSSEQAEQIHLSVDGFSRALVKYHRNHPATWQAPAKTVTTDSVLPDDLVQSARSFLSAFRFDQRNRPDRSFLTHAAPSLYVIPLLRSLNQPQGLALPVWEAVVQVFRARMRARGPTTYGGLQTVGPVELTSVPNTEDRTVMIGDIQIAVESGAKYAAAYIPISPPRRLTKLSIKMTHGYCSATSIERAEQLRFDFVRYCRELRNSAPGSDDELRKIKATLHRVADEETYKVRNGDQPWGDELWDALSRRMEESVTPDIKHQLRGDLGLGGICDLVSQCRVWFSEQFDVGAEIERVKQARVKARI